MVSRPAHRNRLANEPSLYLQQHASNPVDWYPWGTEAFERAKRENKPILLSIGYSACHWCHVMERESFENPSIAELMNEHFVCIKVDREERPDVDRVYMQAVQAMTGRGGWPMTMFLAPDLRPFYGGTYFPPEDRGNRPGFPRILVGVAKAYADDPEKIADQGDQIVEAITEQAPTSAAPVVIDVNAAVSISNRLADVMDSEYGGFGSEPKFPATLALMFMMDVEYLSTGAPSRSQVETALDRMADGGIFDHLGGGFHRYSVDRYWLVPHFEKMLYDQALMADLYTEAWKLFRKPRYKEVCLSVLDYVSREMTGPDGGFYAAQDADSEGVEGKFFVWSVDEIRRQVGPENYELVRRFYGLRDNGNFEGANILYRAAEPEEVAADLGLSVEMVREGLRKSNALLFEARKLREAPARDSKILTDWNGLMIAAMASAGRLFGRRDLVDRATDAARSITDSMFRDETLFHFKAEGKVRVEGLLDDYAFFARACLEVYAATGGREHLQTASRIADQMIERFYDRESACFYATPVNATDMVVRSVDVFDSAVPSGNAVAVDLLERLHTILGTDLYREIAEAALGALLPRVATNAYAGAHLLAVALRRSVGRTIIVLTGDVRDANYEPLLARAFENTVLGAVALETSSSSGNRGEREAELPPAVRGKASELARPAAYVCRGSACSPPVNDPESLTKVLLDFAI